MGLLFPRAIGPACAFTCMFPYNVDAQQESMEPIPLLQIFDSGLMN